MNEKKKKAIYEAYVAGEKTKDIAERFEVSVPYVCRIAKGMGAGGRITKSARGGKKTCPKCHRKIEVKDAKFCYYCGSDIRSAKDILIERVRKVADLISFLPAHAQDELRDVICDVIAELQK